MAETSLHQRKTTQGPEHGTHYSFPLRPDPSQPHSLNNKTAGEEMFGQNHHTKNEQSNSDAHTHHTQETHHTQDTHHRHPLPEDSTRAAPVQLVHRKQLPHHLQFNPYIESGYRPLLSSWDCVKSLLYLHNETVNIITHGVPMLYILLQWRVLLPWDEVTVPVLPYTHLLSCVSPWVGSTIYHLFMNHKAGEDCYRNLLHMDMFGIWITQSFGALTTVYASVSCLEVVWVWRVLAGYCFVSLWCLYKVLNAETILERRLSSSMAAVAQICVFIVRYSKFGGGDPSATPHYIMQDLLAVVGGFVGAMRIPEKWLPPTTVDLVANSHHIMHVVVVWAVYHLHQGATLDLLWLSRNHQCHGVMG